MTPTYQMLIQKLHTDFVLLDGGTGSLLQSRGLPAGMPPEYWNITHPEEIIRLHYEYLCAGSDVICTNTFGANGYKLKDAPYSQESLIKAAFANAHTAREQWYAHCDAEGLPRTPKYIAMDIGPLGKLLQPLGDLPFEDAVSLFGRMAELGQRYGADLILIETISDAYEAKAAILGAREYAELPILCCTVFDSTGRLMTGGTPVSVTALAEGMGVCGIGANCGLGPVQLQDVMEQFCSWASQPVICKPNAGLPRLQDGITTYDISPAEFALAMRPIIEGGARIVGGCCGTTPAHIAALRELLDTLTPCPLQAKEDTLIASYTHAVAIGHTPVLIGERINPTGKPRLKRALREQDWQYVQTEGVRQQEEGAHAIDVNMGLPGIDEAAAMEQAIRALQSVTDLPLQIDTADPAAVERGLRIYNGKPLINSVSGKGESLSAVLPLAAKYGGVLICLTLDDDGIPTSAKDRLAIARKICDRAAEYGIPKKDLIIDPLAMTISAGGLSANVTLESIRLLKADGFRCSLGVSNISFGLPSREAINAAFFAMALQAGLDAAILNVHSASMMQTYHSYLALTGQDPSCAAYIAYMQAHPMAAAPKTAAPAADAPDQADTLQQKLLRGMGKAACTQLETLLSDGQDPLALIDLYIVPALNAAGRAFEQGTMFLPQLLLCAEAATEALALLKEHILRRGQTATAKGRVLLATVHGDIHDIGKNIVKTLLQSYGFAVLDLGKDVPAEVIADTAAREGITLVGLSALMTTTLPAMEATIALLRRQPACKVVVGGAVLTQEYADSIGADFYANTAMDTVRYAEQYFAACTPAK